MNTALAQQIANEGGVEAWMIAQQHKSLLRFLTCGSVDDGKSTLIGRLLHDTRQIYEDQLSSLHNDSKRHGTQGEKLDLALLVDGLQAEREQGITIDVAYRYFSTEKRKFIIGICSRSKLTICAAMFFIAPPRKSSQCLSGRVLVCWQSHQPVACCG